MFIKICLLTTLVTLFIPFAGSGYAYERSWILWVEHTEQKANGSFVNTPWFILKVFDTKSACYKHVENVARFHKESDERFFKEIPPEQHSSYQKVPIYHTPGEMTQSWITGYLDKPDSHRETHRCLPDNIDPSSLSERSLR